MSVRGIVAVVSAVLAFAIGPMPLSLVYAQPRPDSQWVFEGPDGKLQYLTDAEGDRIPDFSTSGYRGGTERIPSATVQVIVNPGTGDDSARIQAAIDQVSALPVGSDGLRGAVLLTRGQYEVAQTLKIQTNGVVLRGEGQYGNGTIVKATGSTQRNALEVIGNDPTPFWSRVSNSTVDLIDHYVPVGATTFNVENGHSFSAGDNIVINRGSTQAWFEDIGTDQLEFPWVPGSRDLRFDRTITEVNGNRITVDAPIANGLEPGTYGEVTAYKYTFPDRVRNVGIENLRFVSETNGSDTDENHAWTAIRIDAAEDVWVRQVDTKNFGYAAVQTGKTAKAVTVEDVSYLDPVSQISGGRRYSFALQGSENLVQRVFSEDARHDFVMGSSAAGPNVFLFATAKDTNNDIGPHHRWSAGTLFDNVHVTGDEINVRWRGNSGTGHGWAGANMVVWNSVADAFEIQDPPTAQNWLIGATGGPVRVGDFQEDSYPGNLELGYTDSVGTPVAPNSLYIAQLGERLGSQANDPINVLIETRSSVLGDIDNFSFQTDGRDEFFVESDFLFGIDETSSFGLGTFDSTQKDRVLAFTHELNLAPGEEVVSANLTLQLRVLDTSFYANDVLRLDNHAARFHLSDTLGIPQDLQAGDDYVLELDLVDFFGPLLSPLQDGEFSVFLSDDHAIDFSSLTYDVASITSLLGDFDQDGDVDLEDLDQYNGNIGEAAVGNLEALDLDMDGIVGVNDFQQHYETLVETSNGGKGTFAGDLNLDGTVSVLGDAFTLVSKLGNSVSSWADGDVNADGTVNVLGDAFPLVSNLGKTNGGAAGSISAVPEPGSMTLLVFAGLTAVSKRHRSFDR
jgi:hypothetical protein